MFCKIYIRILLKLQSRSYGLLHESKSDMNDMSQSDDKLGVKIDTILIQKFSVFFIIIMF